MQIGMCGSCSQEVLSFIKAGSFAGDCRPLLVFAKYDDLIVSELAKVFPNAKILVDKKDQLARYGLKRSSDALYIISSDKIIDIELSEDNFAFAAASFQKLPCAASGVVSN